MKFSFDLENQDIDKMITNAMSKKIAENIDGRLDSMVATILNTKIDRLCDAKLSKEATRRLETRIAVAIDDALGPYRSRSENIKKVVADVAKQLIKGTL